jgi:hypothetical protein
MAKINEVLVGAKFEYNIGTTLEPIWATTTLDVQDLEWLERDSNDFNSKHRPITLTKQILVDWYGFKDMNDSMGFTLQLNDFVQFRLWLAKDDDGNNIWSENHCDIFQKEDGGDGYHQASLINTQIDYLHQLQLLIQALTNKPLKHKQNG